MVKCQAYLQVILRAYICTLPLTGRGFRGRGHLSGAYSCAAADRGYNNIAMTKMHMSACSAFPVFSHQVFKVVSPVRSPRGKWHRIRGKETRLPDSFHGSNAISALIELKIEGGKWQKRHRMGGSQEAYVRETFTVYPAPTVSCPLGMQRVPYLTLIYSIDDSGNL